MFKVCNDSPPITDSKPDVFLFLVDTGYGIELRAIVEGNPIHSYNHLLKIDQSGRFTLSSGIGPEFGFRTNSFGKLEVL